MIEKNERPVSDAEAGQLRRDACDFDNLCRRMQGIIRDWEIKPVYAKTGLPNEKPVKRAEIADLQKILNEMKEQAVKLRAMTININDRPNYEPLRSKNKTAVLSF
jgi:hypothetical protein